MSIEIAVMAKIQFTLDAWLKDKSQKVETRDGRTARIICTDAKADDGSCIIALIPGYGGEEAYQFFPDGRAFSSKSSIEDCADLFIVTPEPELSEFEKAFLERVFHQKAEDLDEENREIFREDARRVLELAREQFIKDGYIIEKKAFHDAVENISDKHQAKMSVQYSLHCKVEDGTRHAIMNWNEFQKVAQHFINCGKAEALKEFEEKYKQSWFNEGKIAGRFEGLTEDKKYQQGVYDGKEEALKDLPRWRKLNNIHEGLPYRSLVLYGMDDKKWEIVDKGKQIGVLAMYIPIGDLKELPKDYNGGLLGFKDDSHE